MRKRSNPEFTGGFEREGTRNWYGGNTIISLDLSILSAYTLSARATRSACF